jgi:vacuolar-type H+-ATPase subunit H
MRGISVTKYFNLAEFSFNYRDYYLGADQKFYSNKSGQMREVTPIRSQLNGYHVNVPRLINTVKKSKVWEEFISDAKKAVDDHRDEPNKVWEEFISDAKKAVDDHRDEPNKVWEELISVAKKAVDDHRDELNDVNLPLKSDLLTLRLRQNVYIVSSVDDQGRPVFSDNPRLHESEESASQEVIRLIHKNPGRRYAFFKCCGVGQHYLSVTWS